MSFYMYSGNSVVLFQNDVFLDKQNGMICLRILALFSFISTLWLEPSNVRSPEPSPSYFDLLCFCFSIRSMLGVQYFLHHLWQPSYITCMGSAIKIIAGPTCVSGLSKSTAFFFQLSAHLLHQPYKSRNLFICVQFANCLQCHVFVQMFDRVYTYF